MAPTAIATPQVLTDPGYLFWAPLATVEPTHTSTASKFSDAWPVGWVPLGATTDGTEFSYAIKVDQIEVAEFLDPIKIVTTERSGSITFNLTDFTAKRLQLALNGGATMSSTGTAATTITTVSPPVPGSEARCMIGWEALDNTVRLIARQTLQSSEVKVLFAKSPKFSDIPCTFDFEVPPTLTPFSAYFAGVAGTGGGRG